MVRLAAYALLSLGSLGLLLFEAPHGGLLTSTPEKGQVGQADPTVAGRTVRGTGPAFIYLGGGYHGGK
jgi:hypothetical protein